jgi:hypothetical protein
VTSSSVCQRDCPGGWIPFDGHCYIAEESSANWADAEIDCNNKGGHLASIHSADESNFIHSLDPGWLWIGGTDAAVEVDFTKNIQV